MYIKDFLGEDAKLWDTRILATDISTDALCRAKKGVYELPDGIPQDWLQKYFVHTPEGHMVAKSIKDNVLFRQFNLMEPTTSTNST